MTRRHGNTGNRSAAKAVRADDRIVIRVPRTEKVELEKRAAEAGLTLSAWARKQLQIRDTAQAKDS